VLVQLAELDLRAGDLASASAHAREGLALASTPEQHLTASLVLAAAVGARTGWAEAVKLLQAEAGRARDRHPGLELRIEAAAAALRVCGNASPCESPAISADADSVAGTSSAERAMLSACATHMTVIGAGSAVRVRDLCARAPGDRPAPLAGIDDVADYLACRTAILADGSDLVELTLARQSEAEPDTMASEGCEPSRHALRSQLSLAQGDLAGADTEAQAAFALLYGLPPSLLARRVRSDLLALMVMVQIEQSRYDEAAKALAQLTDAGDAPSLVAASLRLALALALSKPAEAITCAAELEREPIGIAAPGISWRPWAALAHHSAGDRKRSLALATAHLEHARAWGAPSSLGHALVIRGVVEPGKNRVELIEEAVAMLEETSARLELARACIELGAALRRARRRREARAQLVRGADLAHRCSATSLSTRARAELLAVGARPRRDAFSGVGSLTLSELRVARLAARGMSNREIAQEFVVSIKTVSGQLTAVYRKLNVHDRTALATVMAGAGDGDRPISARKPQAR
jgi:DNA-binding CsgD family transcriptional regulator